MALAVGFVSSTGRSPARQVPEGALGFLLAGDRSTLSTSQGDASMVG